MKSNRKAVYLLPNLFTTANVAVGFYSIISTYAGHFVLAAWMIILGVLFDNLDGKIARLTNTQSNFGAEYDSLSDLVSFGIAPSFLLYSLVLNGFGRLGIIAAFLYVLTGALRLVRFNVQRTRVSDFVGLPIPGAGLLIAGLVLLFERFSIGFSGFGWFFLVLTYSLAFLMVSPIRYRSFKHVNLNGRISMRVFVLVVLLISLLIFKPSIFIPFVAFLYAFSGVGDALYRRVVRRNKVKEFGDEEEDLDI